MEFNMRNFETSNYIFMAWKGSLEVPLTSLLCLRYCSHTDMQGKPPLIIPLAPKQRREADPLAVNWFKSEDVLQ